MNDVKVTLAGVNLTLTPRAFASGKLGWGYSGKLPVDGVNCQISLNIVIPHSEASVTDEAKRLREVQAARKG